MIESIVNNAIAIALLHFVSDVAFQNQCNPCDNMSLSQLLTVGSVAQIKKGILPNTFIIQVGFPILSHDMKLVSTNNIEYLILRFYPPNPAV